MKNYKKVLELAISKKGDNFIINKKVFDKVLDMHKKEVLKEKQDNCKHEYDSYTKIVELLFECKKCGLRLTEMESEIIQINL